MGRSEGARVTLRPPGSRDLSSLRRSSCSAGSALRIQSSSIRASASNRLSGGFYTETRPLCRPPLDSECLPHRGLERSQRGDRSIRNALSGSRGGPAAARLVEEANRSARSSSRPGLDACERGPRTCRNASARTEVIELMTHNANGEVIDAYTSWEWSTLCDEITKLEVDLERTKLAVLPLAKREIPETAAVSGQLFASDFATRDQSEMISNGYRWRRWESNPAHSDTLTLRGHSVFPRIAVKGT